MPTASSSLPVDRRNFRRFRLSRVVQGSSEQSRRFVHRTPETFRSEVRCTQDGQPNELVQLSSENDIGFLCNDVCECCINVRLRTMPAWAFPRPVGRGRVVVLRIEPPIGVSPLRASIPNVSAPLALRAPLAVGALLKCQPSANTYLRDTITLYQWRCVNADYCCG